MFAGLCSARRTRRGCTGRRSSGWSWAATRRAGGPAPGRPARPSTAPRRRSASTDHSSSDVIICSFPWYKSPSKDWSHCFSLCWMWWWDTSWVLLNQGTPLTSPFSFILLPISSSISILKMRCNAVDSRWIIRPGGPWSNEVWSLGSSGNICHCSSPAAIKMSPVHL